MQIREDEIVRHRLRCLLRVASYLGLDNDLLENDEIPWRYGELRDGLCHGLSMSKTDMEDQLRDDFK